MGTYLVVAHQTAESRELIDGLKTLQLRDPEAQFVLLVPATPRKIPGSTEEAREAAEAVAVSAKQAFEADRLRVLEAKAGHGLPLRAIDDELEAKSRIYNGIVISTFPAEVSQWLGQDLPRRVERRWGLPVRHIIAHSAAGRPTGG